MDTSLVNSFTADLSQRKDRIIAVTGEIKTLIDEYEECSVSDLQNMIGIKDDVLHLFLIFHVLLFLSFTVLIILVVVYLCTKVPASRRDPGGWFGGPSRSQDQVSYFTTSPPPRRRGLFSR